MITVSASGICMFAESITKNPDKPLFKAVMAAKRWDSQKSENVTIRLTCMFSGKRATSLPRFIEKGTFFTISGELIEEEYTNRDGQTVKSLKVWPNQVEFNNPKGKATAASTTPTHNAEVKAFVAPEDDDIPF